MVLMVTVPGGSYVTVRDRPNNVLGGSNRKLGSKSPKIGSPPYFYFRFGRLSPLDGHFWPIWPPLAPLGGPHHWIDIYTLPPCGSDKNCRGLGRIAPHFGEMWKFEIWFSANFGLLLVETLNPCVGFFLHISTVLLPDCGLRKSKRNRFVRIREKFRRISEKARICHGDEKIFKVRRP